MYGELKQRKCCDSKKRHAINATEVTKSEKKVAAVVTSPRKNMHLLFGMRHEKLVNKRAKVYSTHQKNRVKPKQMSIVIP